MFDGDYSYELAKERMADAIKAHEHHRLLKQLHLDHKVPHRGMATRAAAFVLALFK